MNPQNSDNATRPFAKMYHKSVFPLSYINPDIDFYTTSFVERIEVTEKSHDDEIATTTSTSRNKSLYGDDWVSTELDLKEENFFSERGKPFLYSFAKSFSFLLT